MNDRIATRVVPEGELCGTSVSEPMPGMSEHEMSGEVIVLHRLAGNADLDAIVRLLANDELGRRRETAPPPLDPAYEAAFATIAADPNHEVVVAETDEGRIVGCLQLSLLPHLTFRGGRRAQIEGVRVADDMRGQGVGRGLFDWAIEQARARGCHVVQLTTNVERPGAAAFYRELGFEESHRGFKLYLQGDARGR